jgi:hypothetical protein
MKCLLKTTVCEDSSFLVLIIKKLHTMNYLIKYRLKNSLSDSFATCSTEAQALSIAKNLKSMNCEYIQIHKVVYDLELTQKV